MSPQLDDTNAAVSVFLAGDVMPGRGIDQILRNRSDPALHESYVRDARTYVRLAEQANGPIPKPAAPDYVWGDALAILERRAPDARIVNLETSVTRSDDYWADKGIHYRMHPGNAECLTAAGLDCCVLANNHVLDWGYAGLEETLDTLRAAGLGTAGAGRTEAEAAAPAVIDAPRKSRVLVFAFGSETSGIPPAWSARRDRAGVRFLPELSASTAAAAAERVAAHARPGDLIIASIHWGGNWGYAIPPEQREFAHALVDRGAAHVIHGHSSHHAKGIEIYRGRPIIYGCGDFLNDYEGISGHEAYRGRLSLAYFLELEDSAEIRAKVEIVPLEIKRFRLHRASSADSEWLRAMLERESAPLGARVERTPEDTLAVLPAAGERAPRNGSNARSGK